MVQRRRLARFSKERSLGAMATGIAHEVNQPLIAIQNYAQAARRRLKSDGGQKAKVDELFDKIEQQTTRAGDIINQVRMLVTSENTDLQPVSWSSLLDEVLSIMKAEIDAHGCRLDCRPAADLPEVLADALQIQLVLINLLQNAVQSMDAVSDNAEKVVSIDIKQINVRELQVSVADRGPGVAADKIEQIFEPLYSEKTSGMGMGLSVCRSIIEAHDGRIRYTPYPSGGAVFQFTLRLAKI